MIQKIVIVGGGSAGWLTAGIIAARFQSSERYIQISLVESPEVSTIGVGEGTWPTMRTTLKKIGLSETEFLSCCDASFKQGSKFIGWRSESSADVYYHPFTLPNQKVTWRFLSAWKRYFPHLSFAEVASFQSKLCDLGVAPKLITMAEYGGAANYAYHLDAGKFVELLKRHCTENLGVNYIRDHVVRIATKDNGDIAAIVTKDNGEIAADLFIDCSGSSAILLAGHYQIPFTSIRQYSFNDRALAMQIPYADDNAPIASATLSTAKSAGWIWDIGLTSRRGTGYVYSEAHSDREAAEREIRNYAAQSIGVAAAESLPVKQLTFEPGHRAEFWHRNVVAVGMAAGFIEPLEASALALVELSANFIRDELPASDDAMTVVAKRFNKLFAYRWQRIVEFLKLHYVLSGRTDTDYWRDVKADSAVPDGLKEMLELWQYRPPYYNDFPHTEEIFPEASYQYILYGMNFQPKFPYVEIAEDASEVLLIKEALSKAKTYRENLPDNRDLLAAMRRHGMSKI